MKNVIFSILLLFMTVGLAQTETTSVYEQETIKVYEVSNGIVSINPSKEVITTETGAKVYKYKNGIKEINPSHIYEASGSDIKVYNVTNGIRSIVPSKLIKSPLSERTTIRNFISRK